MRTMGKGERSEPCIRDEVSPNLGVALYELCEEGPRAWRGRHAASSRGFTQCADELEGVGGRGRLHEHARIGHDSHDPKKDEFCEPKIVGSIHDVLQPTRTPVEVRRVLSESVDEDVDVRNDHR